MLGRELPETVELVQHLSERIREVNSTEPAGADGVRTAFLKQPKCEVPSHRVWCVTYRFTWQVGLKKNQTKDLLSVRRGFKSLLGEVWGAVDKLV